MREVLQGAKNAYRDIVLLNSAASLIVADKVATLTDGVQMAAQAIDTGAALSRLDKLVEASDAATAANMKL